jgi:hypothetical protein
MIKKIITMKCLIIIIAIIDILIKQVFCKNNKNPCKTEIYPIKYCPLYKNLTVTYSNFTERINYNCSSYISKSNSCVFTVDHNENIKGFDLEHDVFFEIGNEKQNVLINLTKSDSIYNDIIKSPPKKRVLYELEPWQECHPFIETITDFYIGIAVGNELYKKYNSNGNEILKYIESILVDTNLIFNQQLGINIVARHIVIDDSNDLEWSNNGCTFDIFNHFNMFTKWNKPSLQGSWHLLDNCYKPGDAIGVAYVSYICSERWASALTYEGKTTFLTFAHEMGHNFGAHHSFEEGPGKTGGIMDYGMKRLDGKHQFNKQYRYNEVCNNIRNEFKDNYCFSNFWSVHSTDNSKCGNNIIDQNEECECGNNKLECECCTNCKLKENAQCSPFLSECCSSDCNYKDTSTLCSTSIGTGVCSYGHCVNTDCSYWGFEDTCGVSSNGCKFKCIINNNCNNLEQYTYDGRPINYIPNGSLCKKRDSDIYQCNSGECVLVPPTNSPTNSPIISPTNSPTNSPIILTPSMHPSMHPSTSCKKRNCIRICKKKCKNKRKKKCKIIIKSCKQKCKKCLI